MGNKSDAPAPPQRALPEEIKLSVTKWEGHWLNKDDYHPRHLLVSGKGQSYFSLSKKERNGKGDWIIFQHQEKEAFFPTAVGIRNNWSGSAIKRIAIDGGIAGWTGVSFEPWIEISGIEKQSYERQRFPIDAVARKKAVNKQFTHYKLRILENYGDRDGDNAFFEFALFGKKGNAMRSYLKQHGMYQI